MNPPGHGVPFAFFNFHRQQGFQILCVGVLFPLGLLGHGRKLRSDRGRPESFTVLLNRRLFDPAGCGGH